MKILIIDGSENRNSKAQGMLTKSLVNHWTKRLNKDHEVVITQISEGYKPQEQRNLFLNIDLVIFQFPVYWFSIPSTAKKYLDDVFDSNQLYEHANNYGSGGLLNSDYILSTTWNANEKEFSDKERFFKGLSPDDVFFPVHKSFEYIGMKCIGSVHNHEVLTKPDIEKYKNSIDILIKKLKLDI